VEVGRDGGPVDVEELGEFSKRGAFSASCDEIVDL
jgi:hypothetical protein